MASCAIDAMRTAGRRVDQLELNGECRHGTFVPPTIIEIGISAN